MKRYRVRYFLGNGKKIHEAVLDLLEETPTQYVFSARPVAGTQWLDKRQLHDMEEVPSTTPIGFKR